MLNSIRSCSLLTSPTRFFSNCTPSLLDHIYSNMSNHPKTSGICLYDISDHLPTFLMIETLKHPVLRKPSYKRSMKNFDIKNFLVDLHKHVENINVSNPNTSVNSNATSLSSVFELALNKYAPPRPMSRREKRVSQKPWISKGILKSIKTKNKLFKRHYGSNDPDKKLFCTQFLNKLTHIKSLAKRCYYENLIKENQGNSYRTWSIIGELIDYKSKKRKSKMPTTMDIEGHTCNTSSEAFLNKLCEYFANVGATIKDAKSLNNLALTIHSNRCQSFVLHEITEEEVNTCINNIKQQQQQHFYFDKIKQNNSA